MYRSLRSFIADARHNWLLAVPAGLYAVNNYLKFAMQLYFRPTTTKMLGNLKIFTIAILMRTVMHRHFNILQYEALFLLVAGGLGCRWEGGAVAVAVKQSQGTERQAEGTQRRLGMQLWSTKPSVGSAGPLCSYWMAWSSCSVVGCMGGGSGC
jgi:hypothetical protein